MTSLYSSSAALRWDRPWPMRLMDHLYAAWRCWRGRPRSPVPVPPRSRDFRATEHLSAHTLKDIGAPVWMQSQAAARHAAELVRAQRLPG